MLASAAVSGTNASGGTTPVTLALPSPVEMETGHAYTFYLDVTSGRTAVYDYRSDVYNGGMAYRGRSPEEAYSLAGMDLTFTLAFDAPSWISVSPTSGTTAAGGSDNVMVAFDAVGLPGGTYTADLVVNSNASATPSVTVPVTLTVQAEGPPVITVAPEAVTTTISDGTATTETVDVSNDAVAGGLRLEWSAALANVMGAPYLAACADGQALSQASTSGAPPYLQSSLPGPNDLSGAGQSFVAPCTGTLSGVTLQVFGSSYPGEDWGGTLYVYNGVGTAGTVLASAAVSGTNASGVAPIMIPLPVAEVEAGSAYTFYLDVTSGRTAMMWSSADPYAYGTSYFGRSPGSASARGAQDLTFSLDFGGPTSLNTDWISASGVSGIVNPGQSQPVTLSLDAAGLAGGTYTADLIVTSNDPATPSVTVPVTFNVGAPGPPAIAVTPASVNTTLRTHETGTQAVSIANVAASGDLDLAWSASLSDGNGGEPSWATLSATSGTTAPRGTTGLTLTFDPAGLALGTHTANLVVTSNDPTTPLVTVPLSLTVKSSAGVFGPKVLAQLGGNIDGGAPGGQFGTSVSADGNRVAVGVPQNGAGYIRVYEYDGSAWVQIGADIVGENNGDLSGYSVSLDGDRLAIGAPWNDGTANHAGHVRIYEYDGNAWVQIGADIDGEVANDWSGWSVSLDGDRLAIGARYNDGAGDGAGHVRVYEYGGGTWTQIGADIDGKAAKEWLGSSVSLDGDRLAASAPGGVGRVRVFEYDGAAWTQTGTDLEGERATVATLATTVSLDGDHLAIGLPQANRTRVYEYGGGGWMQIGADIYESAMHGFGTSVSLENNRLAVGAPSDSEAGTEAGQARVYEYDGVAWAQIGGQRMIGDASQDWFGSSVSLSGDFVAVGAPFNDGAGIDAGRVRIYGVVNGPLTFTATLTGAPGYRMLALPTGTYNDLLGPLWTQGFPGADNEDGQCSVLQWDEASGDFEVGYVCLPDQDAAAVRGAGLFAYVYQDDDNNASTGPGAFPKTLVVTGAAAEAPFSAFPLSYTVPDTPTAPAWEWGWNLLGNPLTDAFDWDLTVRTGGLTETVYVYDPNYFGGDYRTWTAGLGGDLPDGVVPAFQGFFAKAAGVSPGLEVPLAAVVDPGPDVHGLTASGGSASGARGSEAKAATSAPTSLRFELSLDDSPVSVAFVAAAPEAALGFDVRDAYRLTPSAWPRTVLSTRTVGDTEPTPLALNALPADAVGEITLPLEIAADGHASGALALSLAWTGDLPEGWTAALLDRETGATVPVVEAGSYAFNVDVPDAKAAPAKARGEGSLPGLGLDLGTPGRTPEAARQAARKTASGGAVSTGERFVLVLTPGTTTPTFALSLTPEDAPVVLGERGGRVVFEIAGANETEEALTQDVWLAVTDPAGNEEVRSLGSVTIPAGRSGSKRFRVRVGASSPAGAYTVAAYSGAYPDGPLGSASFTFEKAGDPAASGATARGLSAKGAGGVLVSVEIEDDLAPWVIADAAVTVAEPSGFGLEAPRPNPTRGAVRVRYLLSETGPVRLAVYDALGREVAVLVDGSRPAGSHEASLSEGVLAPGVYIVHLASGERTEVRRLTVVR